MIGSAKNLRKLVSDSSTVHLQKITIDPEEEPKRNSQGEFAVDQALAIVIAFLAVYLYLAYRDWVWCPGWLQRLVMDEGERPTGSAGQTRPRAACGKRVVAG